MKQAGIIGGGGYTAGELIRILTNHPEVELRFVQSQSQAGKPLSEVHEDLLGEVDMSFTAEPALDEADILFLCMGHGRSAQFLAQTQLPEDQLLIDLSHDFRLHPDWTYGLPEWQAERIAGARRIANPGCFATAIQLALLPLAAAALLKHDVHIHAITGSTGAGQSPRATSHFSWRNNNLSVYKPFQHQHLAEISQTLTRLQAGFSAQLNFLPLRGNFARGIFASLYTTSELTENQARELYTDFYAEAPFTIVSDQNPNLKQVVNTNKCILHLERHQDKLLVISAIDNLLKGASGQAVENMNLACGFARAQGLRLKAMAF